MQALVNLILANAYTLMNLHNRAEIACRKASAILTLAGSSSSLSLAYFIWGNILTSKGDWGGAITVWRDGLAVDLAGSDVRGQAEKLHCIAQATVMQHYSSNHLPISDAVYESNCSIKMTTKLPKLLLILINCKHKLPSPASVLLMLCNI